MPFNCQEVYKENHFIPSFINILTFYLEQLSGGILNMVTHWGNGVLKTVFIYGKWG